MEAIAGSRRNNHVKSCQIWSESIFQKYVKCILNVKKLAALLPAFL